MEKKKVLWIIFGVIVLILIGVNVDYKPLFPFSAEEINSISVTVVAQDTVVTEERDWTLMNEQRYSGNAEDPVIAEMIELLMNAKCHYSLNSFQELDREEVKQTMENYPYEKKYLEVTAATEDGAFRIYCLEDGSIYQMPLTGNYGEETRVYQSGFFGAGKNVRLIQRIYDVINPSELSYAAKPVIYLYPEEVTEASVYLDYDGHFTCTYPAYNDGWEVTAYPDGTLIDESGKEYYCLFWEGIGKTEYDMSQGFVVAGSDTAEFLEEKLAYLGLSPAEAQEFIIYWLPKMQEKPYNLITFQTDAYTDQAELNIIPEPDSVLRVFMVYEPLEEELYVEPQELVPGVRTGFTVVEWGGMELQ